MKAENDAACRVVVKTAGERRRGGSRRGAPRRYVLRETGESVVNRRIPKGGTGAALRLTASFVLQWSLSPPPRRVKKKEGKPPLLKSVNRQLLLNHPYRQYSTLGVGKVQQVYASREIAHRQQQLLASIMGLASQDLP